MQAKNSISLARQTLLPKLKIVYARLHTTHSNEPDYHVSPHSHLGANQSPPKLGEERLFLREKMGRRKDDVVVKMKREAHLHSNCWKRVGRWDSAY